MTLCDNPSHAKVSGENYCRLCRKMEKDASEAKRDSLKPMDEEE